MTRILTVGIALSISVAAAAQGTVYTRAWCKHPAHGRSASGYGWISEVFSGRTSEECWRFANGHAQPGTGHSTGCSYVNPNTGEFR